MNNMKLLYKVFAAVAGILALSYCVEDAIQPLTGKYEKPAAYELNTLVSQSVEKGDKKKQMKKKRKQLQILFFRAPTSLQTVNTAMKLKDVCFLEGKL